MANDVYLSSTLNDLRPERDAVLDVLTAQGLGVRQSYSASEQDLIASCLTDVDDCALYVGLIGLRYGHCPADGPVDPENAPEPLSITELEFRQARLRNLDCFIFVKDERAISVLDTDLASGDHGGGKRIRTFRDRLESGRLVRTDRFSTVEQLREKVLAAVLRHRQRGRPSSIFAADEAHPGELATDIAVVVDGPGQDAVDAALHRAVDADRRFMLVRVDPAAPDHLARLDEACATARAVAWHLSPRVVALYQDRPGLLPTALAQQRHRRGAVGALLTGAQAGQALPAGWQFDTVCRADDTLPQVLAGLHRGLRAHVRGISLDRRVGVPVLVFAMTSGEARALVDPRQAWAGADPAEGELRAAQLQSRVQALRRLPALADWPASVYGNTREAWRPFGAAAAPAREMVLRCVERINGHERSRRDRLFIRTEGLKLEPLWYGLDEVLDPQLGSAEAVLRVRDRGCLVLVDEMSLLHPRLRAAARILLRGENVAVLSSHPQDPAAEPVSTQLGEDSPLGVGLLLSRFRDEHDPRCELAIHSPERFERWLHLVLPELVGTLGGHEAQRGLVARVDDLFAGTPVTPTPPAAPR